MVKININEIDCIKTLKNLYLISLPLLASNY